MTKTSFANGAVALVGISLLAFGPVALVAPDAAAEMFGVSAHTAEARAFLWAAATRDVALGGGLLVLLALGASRRVVGAIIMVTALVAVGDAINVSVNGNAQSGTALMLHSGSAVVLLALGGWLVSRAADQGS